MANYNVDIAIALKNSNKLMQLRKELKLATENQIRFNKAAKEANGIAVVTFNKLNKVLSRARSNLDKAALGTASFRRSAKALVNVEKEHNKQLIEKEKLLNKLRIQADPNFIVREQRKLQIQENIRQLRTRKFGNVNPSRPADITFGQVGGKIGPAQLIDNRQGGFLAFSKAADEISKGVKANVKQTTKTASLLAQQSARAAFTDMEFGVAGGQIGPATPLTRAERFGFGKRGQGGGGLFAFPGGKRARIKGGIGSALIGGGFPALFGAGGISSLFGAVAGGAGGALAPGGGFAASIAATAIAAQIEKAIQFRKAVNKLNEEIAGMGIQSEFSRKNIKRLAKEFDVTNDEAVQLAATVKTFGEKQGLGILRAFGSKEIFNALAGLRDTSSVLGKIQQLQEEISEEKRQELLQSLATEGPLKTQVKLQQAILDKKRKSFIEDKKREELIEKQVKMSRAGALGMFVEKDEESPTAQLRRLNEEFDKSNEKQIKLLENQIKINEQMQFLTEFNAPTDELREMLNPMRQILDLSVSIRDGFEESFKGIIKGTMTVQEAFRSMLNRIADHFLDAAARMAATQIQKGFLGLFSNMFNFSQSPLPKNPVQLGGLPSSPGINLPSSPKSIIPPLNKSPSNTMIPSTLPKFPGFRADGGPVKRGGSFIVGERGPELFSPGVSGMITPNHALGGSTSIVVNVDASGSSVEGDEQGGRELGRLISVAIQSELVQQKRPGGLLA